MEIVLPKNVSKIIMMAGLISLSSCEENVPKCDNPEVIKTLYSILNENKAKLRNEAGSRSLIELLTKEISSENTKIANIVTTKNDNELNSCNCEAKVIIERGGSTSEGELEYTTQTTSEKEIIVKIENIPVLVDKYK